MKCNVGKLSFTYLGLPIGANFGKKEVWRSLVDRFRRELSCWKSRNLSFEGQVVLLNLVLSALTVYYLSFFKAPVSVIKTLIQFQRDFHWGGGWGRGRVVKLLGSNGG